MPGQSEPPKRRVELSACTNGWNNRPSCPRVADGGVADFEAQVAVAVLVRSN
jgi:hypothetical protein